MSFLRKVTRYERWQTNSHPHGCYSVTLNLECGHALRRKWSEWKGGRVKCRECKQDS